MKLYNIERLDTPTSQKGLSGLDEAHPFPIWRPSEAEAKEKIGVLRRKLRQMKTMASIVDVAGIALAVVGAVYLVCRVLNLLERIAAK